MSSLEIHHNYIWISEAIRYGIPSDFLICLENALVLCITCHDKLHHDHPKRLPSSVKEGIIAIGTFRNQQDKARKLAVEVDRRAREHFFSVAAPIRRS